MLPLPAGITTTCLKASGGLSWGGAGWVLLPGAKQTGPLVSVCSFAGVAGGASDSLFEAESADILVLFLVHLLGL